MSPDGMMLQNVNLPLFRRIAIGKQLRDKTSGLHLRRFLIIEKEPDAAGADLPEKLLFFFAANKNIPTAAEKQTEIEAVRRAGSRRF